MFKLGPFSNCCAKIIGRSTKKQPFTVAHHHTTKSNRVMTKFNNDIKTFSTTAVLASSDSVMTNKTIRELASQFRKCKNMKEMRLCLTQLEQLASSSGETKPNVALYSIALEMAIKEKKVEDVRKIWSTIKNDLSMVDVQTLSNITLFFGRYYKQYPEQVKNIFNNNGIEVKRKANEKKKLVPSPLYDETSPIEYTQLFFLKRQDPETLVKIAPLTIASAMMHEQWKLASVMIYETVEAILEYDEVLKCSKKNEFLGEFEDNSSFGDNYGSSNKLDPESIELMTEFINSSLRLITRKVRQGMIKISAYTAMSTPKNNQLPVHVTSSEEIYKETATSIMEGLALGLDALNLAIFETKTQNSAPHPMNLDEELCTKLYCMIHSFRVFIDSSPYKKLQEKFRKRVIFKMDNVDDYLTLKYGSYLEKQHIKEDPYVQFRMEYKVNLDKNGEIKSDISNAYVNPNPIPSGSTLILNKLHSVDSTTATVIVEGRSYRTPGELNTQHTVEEQQVPLEQEQEAKLTILDDFINEPDEDGINDKDFGKQSDDTCQEEGVFSRREDERKSFPIEFNKIQQEVLSNELAFARVVENDLRLREELETTTIMLEKQFDLLGSLCENLIGEKMYLNEEYRILKNQLNLALTPKSINHKSSQTSEDSYQKKITSNEPQFNDITTSSTPVKNFPLGNKLESSSTIVKSNETLLELMILDLDIRSKKLKK